jgi:hypothetical protein
VFITEHRGNEENESMAQSERGQTSDGGANNDAHETNEHGVLSTSPFANM